MPDHFKACDAKIRPFTGDTELLCTQLGEHTEHKATLRDYAWPGSETVITWQESDRRTFRGEYVRCADDCVLPIFHRGNHAP